MFRITARSLSLFALLLILVGSGRTFGQNSVSAATTLRSIAVSSSVTGGAQFTIKANLVAAATSNTIVALSSNRPSLVTPPATITIAKGALSASIKVSSSWTTKPANVTITAKLAGVSKSDVVSIVPAVLSSVTTPIEMTEGKSGNLAFRLNATAPATGVTLWLTSSNASVLPVPKTIKVPAGATGITVRSVAGDIANATNVTITASYNGTSVADTTKVSPVTLPGGSVDVTCPSYLLIGSTGMCTVNYEGTGDEVALVVGQTQELVQYYCGEGEYCRASVSPYENQAEAYLYAAAAGTETITVKYTGAIVASTTISISDAVPTLACDVPIQVGQTGSCTLDLGETAPVDLVFYLYEVDENGNVAMPESVTILAGSSQVAFEFEGLKESNGHMGIYALYEGTITGTTLVINAAD